MRRRAEQKLLETAPLTVPDLLELATLIRGENGLDLGTRPLHERLDLGPHAATELGALSSALLENTPNLPALFVGQVQSPLKISAEEPTRHFRRSTGTNQLPGIVKMHAESADCHPGEKERRDCQK
jgi:hypothetical protein